MREKFFSENFVDAIERLYHVPCSFWSNADNEFYEKKVRKPFKIFLNDLLRKLKKCDGSINTSANDIIVDCHNYENLILPDDEVVGIGALITHQRKISNQAVTGMIFGFTPKKILLTGGAFRLTGKNIESINNYLDKEHERYKVLLENEDFIETFGGITNTLSEESYPDRKNNATQLDCATGFMGYKKEISARFITDDILPDIIIGHYKAAKLINRLYSRAMKLAKGKVLKSV